MKKTIMNKTLLASVLALSMANATPLSTYAATKTATSTTSIVTASSTSKRTLAYNLYRGMVKTSLKTATMKKVLKLTNDNVDLLATQLTDLLFDIAWANPSTIPTALSQLTKAIKETSNNLTSITASDITEWKNNIVSIYSNNWDLKSDMTLSTIGDMARLSSLSSVNSSLTNGYPISIGEATIKGGEYGNGKKVTLVVLTGTSFVEGQSSGMITDLLSGCETDSVYLESALAAVKENVAKGSDLAIVGFSLGGMVAQQLMVQPDIYNNYNIVEVCSLGAPALMVDERTDTFKANISASNIHRVINYYDLVPYLCLDYFTDATYLDGHIPTEGSVYETLQIEYDHNYKTGFAGTHALGYMEDAVWDNYDFFGYDTREEAGHSVTLNLSNFTYYGSTAITSGSISIIE